MSICLEHTLENELFKSNICGHFVSLVLSTGVDIQHTFDSLYFTDKHISEVNFVVGEIGFWFGNLNSNPVPLKLLWDYAQATSYEQVINMTFFMWQSEEPNKILSLIINFFELFPTLSVTF